LGAVGRKRVPAFAGEQPQITLIGELGIGDRDLAFERGEASLFVRIVGACDLFIKLLVDLGINAADKEARDARDPRNLSALGGQLFKCGLIGLDPLFVGLVGKK